MYTKLEIKGTLEVITGMHIGGSSAFAAIGAVSAVALIIYSIVTRKQDAKIAAEEAAQSN